MKVFFQLIKITVTIPVTFLAFFGFWFAAGHINFNTLIVCFGVFLLAGAASAFNQIMEIGYDTRMVRTRKRPLPSKRISSRHAIYIALIMTMLGVSILSYFNISSVVLGFFTLVWYLGVYTLLKRKTGFAVIPGSLTGALPLLIGFAAAGGVFPNHQIVFLAILVFIWQIPHFWLLMLLYGDDYKQAGYPTLFDVFSPFMVRLWTVGWIFAAFISFLIYPMFHFSVKPLIHQLIPYLSLLAMVFLAYLLIYKPSRKTYKSVFHSINILMLLALFLLVGSK